ncbi:MAG: DUF1194 domain-containing protein [Pseudomonadota bacterium]
MRRCFPLVFGLFLSGLAVPAARACELALVLAVDVSGSVDNMEFRIQMQGIADGLRDPYVSAALVEAEAAVTVLQWTGSNRQSVTLPWRRVGTPAELFTFAEEVAQAPRRWRNFSTAIGEALLFSAGQFAGVPDCKRRVIDVSGDGSSNEGVEPRDVHGEISKLDVTVNAIVIEGAEPDLTRYFRNNVISGAGAFVITAASFDDYPQRMRLKLQREVSIPIAQNHGKRH